MTGVAPATGCAREAPLASLSRRLYPNHSLCWARAGLFALLAWCGFPCGASAQESPKDVIAAHVRLQGYPCDAPKSAQRDLRASRPDEAVWLIDCKTSRYRVRLVPDMADVIEPF